MTTICAEAQLLADAARVLAARHALEPVLERFADAPLDPCAVDELQSWLDDSYPSPAAALDRLRASAAAAPHPPALPQPRLRLAVPRRPGRPAARSRPKRPGAHSRPAAQVEPAAQGRPGRPQRQGRHR
jgi:hypothetical protein